MFNNSSHTASIESILSTTTDVCFGDHAKKQTFQSVGKITDMVRTTIGPYGHDKLLINNGGNTYVTNDAATIIRNLHLKDPIARVVGDVANTQIFNAGDGTTTAILLTGVLLNRAEELYELGLHPTTIIRGYERASDIALNQLWEIATTYDITDHQVAIEVAKTTLAGTNATYQRQHLGELAVETIERVTDKYDVNLNAVRLRTTPGGDMADSRCIDGAIIESVPEGIMTTSKSNHVELLLVDDNITPAESSYDLSVSSDANVPLTSFVDAEQTHILNFTEALQAAEVDLVISTGSVSDEAQRTLLNRGIICIPNITSPNMRFLSRLLDVAPQTNADDLDFDAVTDATIVYDQPPNQTTVETDDASAVTVQLFGQTSTHLEELENNMSNAIEVVAKVASDGRVLPGGGAPEVAMASSVRRDALSIDGRDQLAAAAFADALEIIPMSVADNAGLDGVKLLLALRSAHAEGNHDAGIDVTSKHIVDATTAGIREPLVVKHYAVTHAVEATRMLLRIDGIIEAPEVESRESNM